MVEEKKYTVEEMSSQYCHECETWTVEGHGLYDEEGELVKMYDRTCTICRLTNGS